MMATVGNFGVIYEEAHRSHFVDDNEQSGTVGQEIDAPGAEQCFVFWWRVKIQLFDSVCALVASGRDEFTES